MGIDPNSEQRAAFAYCKNLLSKLGTVTGPAGTGKTVFNIANAVILVVYGKRVFIICPINEIANNFTRKVYVAATVYMKILSVPVPSVLRYQSPETEKAYTELKAIDKPHVDEYLSMQGRIRKLCERPHRVRDRRFILAELSMGQALFEECGFDPTVVQPASGSSGTGEGTSTDPKGKGKQKTTNAPGLPTGQRFPDLTEAERSNLEKATRTELREHSVVDEAALNVSSMLRARKANVADDPQRGFLQDQMNQVCRKIVKQTKIMVGTLTALTSNIAANSDIVELGKFTNNPRLVLCEEAQRLNAVELNPVLSSSTDSFIILPGDTRQIKSFDDFRMTHAGKAVVENNILQVEDARGRPGVSFTMYTAPMVKNLIFSIVPCTTVSLRMVSEPKHIPSRTR